MIHPQGHGMSPRIFPPHKKYLKCASQQQSWMETSGESVNNIQVWARVPAMLLPLKLDSGKCVHEVQGRRRQSRLLYRTGSGLF